MLRLITTTPRDLFASIVHAIRSQKAPGWQFWGNSLVHGRWSPLFEGDKEEEREPQLEMEEEHARGPLVPRVANDLVDLDDEEDEEDEIDAELEEEDEGPDVVGMLVPRLPNDGVLLLEPDLLYDREEPITGETYAEVLECVADLQARAVGLVLALAPSDALWIEVDPHYALGDEGGGGLSKDVWVAARAAPQLRVIQRAAVLEVVTRDPTELLHDVRRAVCKNKAPGWRISAVAESRPWLRFTPDGAHDADVPCLFRSSLEPKRLTLRFEWLPDAECKVGPNNAAKLAAEMHAQAVRLFLIHGRKRLRRIRLACPASCVALGPVPTIA